jgi:hypothetical protein
MATAADREQVAAIIVGYPKILANSEPPNRSSPDKCAYRTGEIPAQNQLSGYATYQELGRTLFSRRLGRNTNGEF